MAEIVKILASKLDNPNAPMPNGYTPLKIAAEENHSEIVLILLAAIQEKTKTLPADVMNFFKQ